MVGKVNMPLEDTEDWPRFAVNQGQDKTLGRCKLEDEQWLLVSLNTAEEGVARCESPGENVSVTLSILSASSTHHCHRLSNFLLPPMPPRSYRKL